jgi:hypothetical protein
LWILWLGFLAVELRFRTCIADLARNLREFSSDDKCESAANWLSLLWDYDARVPGEIKWLSSDLRTVKVHCPVPFSHLLQLCLACLQFHFDRRQRDYQFIRSEFIRQSAIRRKLLARLQTGLIPRS